MVFRTIFAHLGEAPAIEAEDLYESSKAFALVYDPDTDPEVKSHTTEAGQQSTTKTGTGQGDSSDDGEEIDDLKDVPGADLDLEQSGSDSEGDASDEDDAVEKVRKPKKKMTVVRKASKSLISQ